MSNRSCLCVFLYICVFVFFVDACVRFERDVDIEAQDVGDDN